MLKMPITYKVPVSTIGPGGSKSAYPESGYLKDWAQITDVNTLFGQMAGQPAETGVKRFKIRYRPSLAIKDTWLINFNGQDYKIRTIEQGQRNDYFIIIASAVG